jgi:hypothetical protein
MIVNPKTLPYGVDPPGIVAAQEGMRVVTENGTFEEPPRIYSPS